MRADPPRARKPRIAVLSPFPPKASGIADYSARLVRELRSRYAIDLYHDEGYEPDFGRDGRDFGMFDHRLFARNASILDYHSVVYQMGNSLYHRFVYDAMLKHPGLVTLHDFGLAGFHHGHAHQPGVPAGHFARELRHSHPGRADFVLEHRDDWVWNEGTVQDAFAARDLPMNRRVFEAASGVIVHSPLVRSQAEALHPDLADKVRVVPMGSQPRAVGLEEKLRLRDRFGLDRRALIFASFGILHASKMNEETIDAFGPVARAFPEALLAFVGKDLDGGRALARAEALGLRDRVRFLGRREAAEFADLIAASDVGICLRRPPTNGETSAALLDLLRHGIPTIAADSGTFRDYPGHVLRRVSWEAGGTAGLTQAMFDLAGDRESLGRAAFRHVADHHSWASCARGYADAIEALASSRIRPIIRRPLAAS